MSQEEGQEEKILVTAAIVNAKVEDDHVDSHKDATVAATVANQCCMSHHIHNKARAERKGELFQKQSNNRSRKCY